MAESLDATFFAFRKREQSGVLTRAAVAFVIVGAALVAAFMFAMWGSISTVMGWYAQMLSAATQNPSAAPMIAPPAALFTLGPAYLLFIFAFFVLLAAFEAACLRWMVRGEAGGGFMGLSLGADTWRVYATYWVWFFSFIAGYLGLILMAIFLGGIGGAMGGESAAGGTIMIVMLACAAYLLAWLYVSVRLAPAAATSIGRGRFSFFKAWSVTSGRFWAIFGAFLLLAVIYIVAGTILSTIMFSVVMAGAFSNLDPTMAATNPDAFLQAYFTGIMSLFSNPTTIAVFVVFQLISWALYVVFYILFYGVNARAVEAALAEGKIERASA
ncbi:hypothetical protein U91I_03189 [alpha proteobacterium U9-1i]|nr:hypothetical protein U91I_03189 [alpha proteobacterium U9-1i]